MISKVFYEVSLIGPSHWSYNYPGASLSHRSINHGASRSNKDKFLHQLGAFKFSILNQSQH